MDDVNEHGTKLAFLALLAALRQSGIIDKQAVRSVSERLKHFSAQSQEHCAATADWLGDLALMIETGPLKTCVVKVPQRVWSITPAP